MMRTGSNTRSSEVGFAIGGPAHRLRRGTYYRRRRGGALPALDRHGDVLASFGALSARGRDPYRGGADRVAGASRSRPPALSSTERITSPRRPEKVRLQLRLQLRLFAASSASLRRQLRTADCR